MKNGKLSVALVGLGFGGAFVGIYKAHPDVGAVYICDKDPSLHAHFLDNGLADGTFGSLEEILADDSVDAVHLVTPIPLHAQQTLAVLNAGKHCACTVPMATSVEDLYRIAEAKKRSGKHYMMMETTLYTYQYLYAQRMLNTGEMGEVQFLRGSHYQDMENWPPYWLGLPPMWYGTHAIAPMIGISSSRISRVSCLGSGTMGAKYQAQYNNPFPVETAHFVFENGLKGEATRSLFRTAREYQEGMFVYGSKASFEWGFRDGDNPIITHLNPPVEGSRGGVTPSETMVMPNFLDDLPEELWRFTVGSNYDPLNPQKSLMVGAGAGHHGSHPHLVNEFVRSIVENREPAINVALGANITAAGLCAHASALQEGAWVAVPEIQ